MARRIADNLEFGSDSFLDIVANIVGILIILIVIAGVRISQTPLNSSTAVNLPAEIVEMSASASPVSATENIASAVAAAVTELPVEFAQTPETEIKFDIQLGEQVDFAPVIPHSWKQQSQALVNSQQDLMRALRTQQQELQQIATDHQLAVNNLNDIRQQLQQQQNQVTAQQVQFQQKREQLAVKTSQLAQLSEQLVLMQRANQPQQTLEHRMVPVGKRVNGKEWHFEVREGKITFIPLNELLDQLKTKVERWVDWIAKYDRHEGVVGPIEGFSLSYKVSRQQQSISDELSRGSGSFRITLEQWELISNGNGFSETLDQARLDNSQFRSTLNRCSFEDTITLWVYPDSFEMYQELTSIAHQLGYQVAARPLPAGKRISGSPQGSRSVSQ